MMLKCLLFAAALCSITVIARAQDGAIDTTHYTLRSRMTYKEAGFPNVVTAHLPGLFITDGCLAFLAGIEYERFLTKRGTFSLSVPGYWFSGSTFDYGGFFPGEIISRINGAFVVPAVMWHPAGNRHRTDFSIGPALVVGEIHRRTDRETDYTVHPPGQLYNRRDNLTALMGTVSIMRHTNGAFVYAAHASIGGIIDAGPTHGLIVQLGMQFGGRF